MGQTDYSVMNIASLLFAALLGFTATAQAQSFTKPAADQSLPAPSAGKAQIVFIRATDAFIYKILSWLAEVTPEKDVLISSMQNKTKVVYETTPGEHLFMSHSPVWTHFMIANVEAGKRYYVLVRPVHGRGFQMRPLRKDGSTDYNTSLPQFPAWLKDTETVETGPDFPPYLARFQAKLDETRAKGWEDWKGKSSSQIAELTLNPADGFDP